MKQTLAELNKYNKYKDAFFIEIKNESICPGLNRKILFPVKFTLTKNESIIDGALTVSNKYIILKEGMPIIFKNNFTNKFGTNKIAISHVKTTNSDKTTCNITFEDLYFSTLRNRAVTATITSTTAKTLLTGLLLILQIDADITDFSISKIVYQKVSYFNIIKDLISLLEFVNNCKLFLIHSDNSFKLVKSNAVAASFIEGVDFTSIDIEEDVSTIVNRIFLYRAKETDMKSIELAATATDNASYLRYGYREKKIVLPYYVDSTTASNLAQSILANLSKPNKAIKINNLVVHNSYSNILNKFYQQYRFYYIKKIYKVLNEFYDINKIDKTNFTGTIGWTSGTDVTSSMNYSYLQVSISQASRGGFIDIILDTPIRIAELQLIADMSSDYSHAGLLKIECLDELNNSLGNVSYLLKQHTTAINNTLIYKPTYTYSPALNAIAIDNDFCLALDSQYTLAFECLPIQKAAKIRLTFDSTAGTISGTIGFRFYEIKYYSEIGNYIDISLDRIDVELYQRHSVMQITSESVNKDLLGVIENVIKTGNTLRDIMTNA